MSNGQVNASARLVKLYIGEPARFAIPLSFYGGVSNNNFQSQNVQFAKSNDHLVNQYLNPLSGLVNISVDGNISFSKTNNITRFSGIYQVGERLLNGIRIGPATDPRTGKPVNFLNTFATTGFVFQTGAWEKNDLKNVGMFWLAIRYHSCYTKPAQILEFLPDVKTKGFYDGFSYGFGIEINNVVSIKAIYYKYSHKPEIDYGLPIYQFTFNYQVQK